jgi:tetratricopeptide (TPR) repeat protein
MRKITLLNLLMIILLGLNAQNQKLIDSLILQLNQEMTDTSRVNLLNKIAGELFYVNHDQIFDYAQKALDLSEDLDYSKGIAEAYNNLGIYYRSKGMYDFAIDYFFNSLEIMEKINDRNGIGRCYNLIGILYYYLENYNLSLEYYNKALAINIEQNDKKWIAGNYNNLGMIYEKLHEYGLALEYYFKSLEANIELNNKNWIANNYGNIGSLYQEMGNPKSLEYLLKRLQLNTELKDASGIAQSNYLIGRYYNTRAKYADAITYLLKSYYLSDSIGNLYQTNKITEELSNAYEGDGNYREAYTYHVIHKALNDSLNLADNAQKITRLEMQNQFRKDQQLNTLTYQKTKLLQTFVGVFLGILLLISILLIERQRAKAHQHELEQKKLELENKLLKEELQFKDKSFEDNVKYLLNKNDLITKVSERLIKEKPLFKRENQRIIEEVILELQSNIENEMLEEFEVRFNQVHGDFIEKLSKFSPELTANDKKLCCFLKLEMSTKEISSITGQSITSIETARTRLRKKLKIQNQETSLQDFLKKF